MLPKQGGEFEGSLSLIPERRTHFYQYFVMTTSYVNYATSKFVYRRFFENSPSDDGLWEQLGGFEPLDEFLSSTSKQQREDLWFSMRRSIMLNLKGQPDLNTMSISENGKLDLTSIAKKLKENPIWIYHGQEDRFATIQASRFLEKRFKENGAANVELHEIPKQGHAYSLTSLFENLERLLTSLSEKSWTSMS